MTPYAARGAAPARGPHRFRGAFRLPRALPTQAGY